MSNGAPAVAASKNKNNATDRQTELAQIPVGSTQPLKNNISAALDNYFDQLGGQMVTDVYQMVLSEVEAPLLRSVMRYTRNNQTKASMVLGLNRGTLRKKLKQHGLL